MTNVDIVERIMKEIREIPLTRNEFTDRAKRDDALVLILSDLVKGKKGYIRFRRLNTEYKTEYKTEVGYVE